MRIELVKGDEANELKWQRYFFATALLGVTLLLVNYTLI